MANSPLQDRSIASSVAAAGAPRRPVSVLRAGGGTFCRALVCLALVAFTGAVGCSGSPETGTQPETSTTSTTPAAAPLPPSTVAAPDGATITQPAQAVSGPGSSDLAHRDWEVSSGGSGADGWYVFEPTTPRAESAPLAIVMHGYFDFEDYDNMYELIRHTVLRGSVVIYPRWQTSLVEPCPGPFDIEPCMESSVAGIRGALEFLQKDPDRVQPDLDRTSYFGFSFGGILTANLTNRWRQLDLPEPRAVFLDDLHDSGLNGLGEPSLDESLAGIPASVLLVCHNGAQGVIAEDPTGGCNALFPKLDHIPVENKAIVLTAPDDHGQPPLSSGHGVCSAGRGDANAYDWNFCWKAWDTIRADGDSRRPGGALVDEDLGSWSDGTPITPLKVQQSAPIQP